ncbi:MAG: NAD-dependent malic enzyme [Bryobacteraceae bacterium]
MKQKAVPILPFVTKTHRDSNDFQETAARGQAVLNSPRLNKGAAFSAVERKALGLTGLLPAEISTLEQQVRQAYIQYVRLPDVLSKNSYLTALHDRNEVLFYRLLSEHVLEMIPIVNDLAPALEQAHLECSPPRGVYLSIGQPEAIQEAFLNLGVGPNDIDLILATDAEQILGLGDWGVGGIEVSVGKLAICTAAGGINPRRVIAVMLDVGTNREALLNDPTYIGNRHPRIRGDRYDAFLDNYVKAVTNLFPNAMLQWEDFAPGNSRRILEKYRDQICTFNDNMQGTGAIVLAAAISAVRVCGTPLRNQRIVIFGAGTAGVGVADQLCDAMMRDGLSKAEAAKHFWLVDRQGLLTSDMAGQLREHQVSYARPPGQSKGLTLAEVVRQVRPSMLIGASNAPGSFTEAIVKDMAANTERPIIFPLSDPSARAEATPTDLIAWTEGRALIATGSPFPPVTYRGTTYVVAQANNAMLYPGLVLGAIVSRASRISAGMFAAAANAVSSLVTVRQPGASLLPHIDDLRSVSSTVAVAVAESAVAEGLARVSFGDLAQQVQDAMWQPRYREIRASKSVGAA